MLVLRHRLDDARKQDLADAQGKEEKDRSDLVQPAVDAAVVAVQIVLGKDDVLVVEDLHPDDARGRGQGEPRHDAQAHARADAAEMVTQRIKAQEECDREARKHGRHRAGDGVARLQKNEDDRRADDELEREVQRERRESLQALQDASRDRHLPDQSDRKSEDQNRNGRAAIGRANSVVRRMSARHGIAMSRTVRASRERTPGSPRAFSNAV